MTGQVECTEPRPSNRPSACSIRASAILSSWRSRKRIAASPRRLRRRRSQRLVDQYTEIARLAGGLAHEIKNPLSTIRLNMELLAEDLAEAETPRERRALPRIEVVQQRMPAAADPARRLSELRQGAPAAARSRPT